MMMCLFVYCVLNQFEFVCHRPKRKRALLLSALSPFLRISYMPPDGALNTVCFVVPSPSPVLPPPPTEPTGATTVPSLDELSKALCVYAIDFGIGEGVTSNPPTYTS